MEIRRAKLSDMEGINRLLRQVLSIHHEGRPDLFKKDAKKYTDDELAQIIADNKKPIFVAADDGEVLGYAFCVDMCYSDHNILTNIKTLYIDDLCVDEKMRGRHIGKSLYDFVLAFAKENGYYNITLNVWELNESAKRFYEKCGFGVQKTGMEIIL